MKKWILWLAGLLPLLPNAAAASAVGPDGPLAAPGNPYVHFIGHKGDPIYTTSLAVFSASSVKYQAAYESVAFLYHPLSAGSIIPVKLQAWIPPESWACTVGVGGLSGAGLNQPSARFAVGCGLNLLDSVRGWASALLAKSNNLTARTIGQQIDPTPNGPLSLYVSRVYSDSIDHPGRFAPGWGFGLGLAF